MSFQGGVALITCIVIQQVEKSEAAKKKEYIAALQAEQQNEEAIGFVKAHINQGLFTHCIC